MSKKKVFLLLNGEPPIEIPNMLEYDIICTTDGAYNYLKDNTIVPHFISGDFDSLKQIPKNIEVIHTPNQDLTDFDKVLQILFDRHYKNIHVFGASGKEQDHFLGNLHTAVAWKEKLNITFFDNYSIYFLADKKTKLKGHKSKTVSLIPYPKATGVTTIGLQYPLKDEDLVLGTRTGTRNLAIDDKIEITFRTGNLFIFINT